MQVRGLHILLLYLSLAVAANDLPAPASITAAPELEIRQVANSICGYYSLNGLLSTISCSVNTPCLVGNTLDPTAVGYCSGTNNAPITSIFAFGNYPPGGCTGGQVCCPLAQPTFGKYLFNSGRTVFLGCATTAFEYSAFAATLSAASTPRTSLPLRTSTTSTSRVTDTYSPTARKDGSNGDNSNNNNNTTAIALLVVGAVVALVAGIVFVVVGWKWYRVRHPKVEPHWQNAGYAPQASAQKRSCGLPGWQLGVAITSACLTLAGVIVAIVFGLKQKQ